MKLKKIIKITIFSFLILLLGCAKITDINSRYEIQILT